ncbi:hypothetical protein D3C81_1660810 [compost metagenome]
MERDQGHHPSAIAHHRRHRRTREHCDLFILHLRLSLLAENHRGGRAAAESGHAAVWPVLHRGESAWRLSCGQDGRQPQHRDGIGGLGHKLDRTLLV